MIRSIELRGGDPLPDPTELIDSIVNMPERRLTTIVARDDALLDEAEPQMRDTAENYMLDVDETCSSLNCGADIESSLMDVSDVGVKVLAIGIVCTKACDGCPLGLNPNL